MADAFHKICGKEVKPVFPVFAVFASLRTDQDHKPLGKANASG